MAKKKKYYVVWEGRDTGIFESWPECQKAIKGYAGAKYKSFESKQAAELAFGDSYHKHYNFGGKKKEMSAEERKKYGTPNWDSLAVDAACSGNPGVLEYQGVDTKTGRVLFRQGPFPEGTVNIGEFLAIVHGLAYLKKQGMDDLPIYSDSRTAMKWVRDKRANTLLKRTARNRALFDIMSRGEAWLRANTYKNPILKWETKAWGEIPADFGRK